jgi:SAM-dependent methyltransferase
VKLWGAHPLLLPARVLASVAMSETGPAGRRWSEGLAGWAIPGEILAAAPESPWTFPTELFASRADASTDSLTVSNRRALEALPEGGSVMDVGCGAGAASLPLAGKARTLIGVDVSNEMLQAFEERASRTGAEALVVRGRWPDAAPETPDADVVLCHHVFYNAPDLPAFAAALTDHARSRVVVEMTPNHPQASLNRLWLQFHGLRRPTGPTVDDAVEVLRDVGLDPAWELWQPESRGGFADRRDLVAWIRRRLCLTPERDDEVNEAISDQVIESGGLHTFAPGPVGTLWWDGGA